MIVALSLTLGAGGYTCDSGRAGKEYAGRRYSRREFLRIAAIAAAAVAAGGGLGGLLAACAGGKSAGTTEGAGTSTATSGATTTTATPTTSALEPIVVPTLPAKIPAGYGDVDPATGLHVIGAPQVIELASYRLKVGGKVTRPLSLTYDDIRRLPIVTATPELVCPETFTDIATWSGVPLKTILELAGVLPDAARIRMNGADGHFGFVDLEDPHLPEYFLAYQLRGQTLPVLQGFPLRAVLPGQIGSPWVKWLLEITAE